MWYNENKGVVYDFCNSLLNDLISLLLLYVLGRIKSEATAANISSCIDGQNDDRCQM